MSPLAPTGNDTINVIKKVMNIAKDCVVSIDYTLTDPEGQILDTSSGAGPLSYLHGNDNLIPGLEKALEGKTAGDSFKVTVPAAEAYGLRDEQLVINVPLDRFQGAGIARTAAGGQDVAQRVRIGRLQLPQAAIDRDGDRIRVHRLERFRQRDQPLRGSCAEDRGHRVRDAHHCGHCRGDRLMHGHRAASRESPRHVVTRFWPRLYQAASFKLPVSLQHAPGANPLPCAQCPHGWQPVPRRQRFVYNRLLQPCA